MLLHFLSICRYVILQLQGLKRLDIFVVIYQNKRNGRYWLMFANKVAEICNYENYFQIKQDFYNWKINKI